MPGCCAFGCTNRAEKGFLMKAFPRDPVRRKLWAAMVKRDDWFPTNTSYLCEVHFEADKWEKAREDGKRVLKWNAIPTLFSHRETPKRRRPPPTRHSPKKKEISQGNIETPDPPLSMSSTKKEQKRNSRRKRLKPLEEDQEETKHDTIKAEEDISAILVPEVILEQPSDQTSIDGDTDKELMVHEEYEREDSLEENSMHEEYEREEVLEEKQYSIPFCRLCASPSEDAISIFQNEKSKRVLLEKIHTYLPIMISVEDILPTTVCEKCIEKLEICHKLVQDCLDADIILKTMFGLQNSKQVQDCDKNMADKHSKICHTEDTSNNLLEEDYDYVNFSDTKFEVESNVGILDKQTLNPIAEEKTYELNNDAIQNSNTVDVDMRMGEDSTVLTQNVSKESNVRNIPRKRRGKGKLKFLVVKKNGSGRDTKEADLKKILQLALNSTLYPQNSKSQETKERDEPQEMPPVDNCCVDLHKEISRLNNTEQNFEHIHNKIARDHTYTRKVP